MRHALLFALLLAGCAVDASGRDELDAGTDACDPTLGTLEVCIYGDATSTMAIGGEVTARRSETDVPFLMRAGDDGCAREQLEVGTWEVSADDGSGSCTTPFEPVEILPCETTTVRAEVFMWCVD